MIEDMFADKRKELNDQRRQLEKQKSELDNEIDAIDRELTAIAAYEAVREGKTPPTVAGSSGGGNKGKRRQRLPSIKGEVLDEIKKHPDGVSRKQLVETFAANGDKTNENRLNNALTALKKDGDIDGERGHYQVVTSGSSAAAE